MRRLSLVLLLTLPGIAWGQAVERGPRSAFRPAHGAISQGDGLRGYFVDSVAGDDASSTNPCTKQTAPCKTIARLLAVSPPAGSNIWLKRGSYWREMIVHCDFGITPCLADATKVAPYGPAVTSPVDDLGRARPDDYPTFDGADVISSGSWSKTAGRTSVYQATVNTAAVINRPADGNRVWENWDARTGGPSGGMLTYVADVATCDATAGSWTGPTRPSGGNDVIYVHASDGSDPGTSGRVYELSIRPYGVNAGQYTTDTARIASVRGVKVVRHAHHDGGLLTASYLADFKVDPGGAGPVDPSHGLWCNGTCEDGTTSSTISYGISIAPITVRRVVVTCTSPVGAATTTGVYFHGASGRAQYHQKKVYEDISGVGCTTLFSGNGAQQVAVIRPSATDGTVTHLAAFSYVDRLDIIGARYVQKPGLSAGSYPVVQFSDQDASTATYVLGNRIVGNSAQIIQGAASCVGPITAIGNSLAYRVEVGGAYRVAFGGSGPAWPVTFSRNLTYYAWGPARMYGAGSTVTADRNVYNTDASSWRIGSTDYTWAQWQALPQDANGVREATVLAGSLNDCNTRPTDASAAWSVGAGADAYGDAHLTEWINAIP